MVTLVKSFKAIKLHLSYVHSLAQSLTQSLTHSPSLFSLPLSFPFSLLLSLLPSLLHPLSVSFSTPKGVRLPIFSYSWICSPFIFPSFFSLLKDSRTEALRLISSLIKLMKDCRVQARRQNASSNLLLGRCINISTEFRLTEVTPVMWLTNCIFAFTYYFNGSSYIPPIASLREIEY